MKFGVREICNVVFRAKTMRKIGNTTFQKGQPVLYIDTATASNLEQASTTVYAQGGRGNSRLIAWDGEKTLTFTVTDALMSPMGLSILSGAGLFNGQNYKNVDSADTDLEDNYVHVHTTADAQIVLNSGSYEIDLGDALESDESICFNAPLFVMGMESDGSLDGTMYKSVKQKGTDDDTKNILVVSDSGVEDGALVKVDFYILKGVQKVSELVIDAGHFAGNYYVEADTLFRDQNTGKDLPAVITLPNVKIQSNFTFSMASTGDPSTFDFTMDALPGYTYFDATQKVMCVIQVVNDTTETTDMHSVMDQNSTSHAKSEDDDDTDKVVDSINYKTVTTA